MILAREGNYFVPSRPAVVIWFYVYLQIPKCLPCNTIFPPRPLLSPPRFPFPNTPPPPLRDPLSPPLLRDLSLVSVDKGGPSRHEALAVILAGIGKRIPRTDHFSFFFRGKSLLINTMYMMRGRDPQWELGKSSRTDHVGIANVEIS